VPAIITETPEALYSYTSGVFSYTKPPPPPKPAAGAALPATADKKEPDLSALFLTTAHAVTIVGWGTLDGKPYWKIGTHVSWLLPRSAVLASHTLFALGLTQKIVGQIDGGPKACSCSPVAKTCWVLKA
jgi:hypothetical protein